MTSFPKITTEGEKYTIYTDRSIGKGAYSEVYEGRTASGRLVAVKTALKNVEIKAMHVEVDALRKLKGEPNIVQFIGSCYEVMAPGSVPAQTFSFAMEYAKSSLEAEMRRPENHKGLPADMYIDLVVDCSMALSTLHKKNIAHRDIKHMNILIFPGSPTNGRRSTCLFKMCDLGCSKDLLEDNTHEMRTLVGTPNLLHPFLAREMADPRMARNQHNWKTKEAYSPEQCDLWSLGCTLYFCATGKFPFDSEKKNPQLYFDAANAVVQNPDAIGMVSIVRERNAGRREIMYDFEPITELPSKFNRYPVWLVKTVTCLIRQFFHDPSVEKYVEVASAMRKGKRRTFLSVDQLTIVDHTDMANVPYVGYSIPSLSVCMGYPENTDLLLISNTSTQYFEAKRKNLNGLQDDYYLVLPERREVNVRRVLGRNIEYHEFDDMTDPKLTEVRLKKCYDGLSMLTESDEFCQLFTHVSKILSTQFSLLAGELSNFERVQTTSRFAVYMDMACVPMMLFDSANPETKNITELCIRKANETRQELERHMKKAMDVESTAKQLAKDAMDLRLDDVDLPGMREDLESYFFYRKDEILETREYSQSLVEQCFARRKYIMEQIFKSPDGIRKSKLQQTLGLATSLRHLRSEYQKLQNTISECIDLLEKPFQEMKEVVNRHLEGQGQSRNSMDQSMYLLRPAFRDNQKKVKAAAKTNKELVDKLNQELEDSIKQLGFVRLGDTILRQDSEERTLVNQDVADREINGESSSTLIPPTDTNTIPERIDSSVEPTSEAANSSVLSYSSSEISSTSFESTPPASPGQTGYMQAVMQFFTKPTSS